MSAKKGERHDWISGRVIAGMRRAILYEIERMIGNYEFTTFEHYRALVWFRDRLREKA